MVIGQFVPGGCKDEPSFEIDAAMADPCGIRTGRVSDDFVADQQLPLGSTVTVVGVVWLLRIFRFVGVVRWRLSKLQPIVEQLRRSAITVPATGIQWLQRQPVAIPATGIQWIERRQSVVEWIDPLDD